jgi:hypothetical protein
MQSGSSFPKTPFTLEETVAKTSKSRGDLMLAGELQCITAIKI